MDGYTLIYSFSLLWGQSEAKIESLILLMVELLIVKFTG